MPSKRERRKQELGRRRLRKKLGRAARRPSPEQRWGLLYAKLNRLHREMLPAYNKAVVPVLSGIIGFLGKPELRVLVVGGGKGFFSKDVLPALQAKLAGRQIKIRVVETDIASVIRCAPNAVHRTRANFEQLPFADESFDLVIGQGMMHHGDMVKSIPAIKRVLTKDGFFVHVQDDLPNPIGMGFDWRRSPFIMRQGESIESSARKASELHHGLSARIIETAKRNELSDIVAVVKGSAIVPASHTITEGLDPRVKDANKVVYHLGLIFSINDPKIPKGQKMLSYKGILTILTKGSTTSLLEFLQKQK